MTLASYPTSRDYAKLWRLSRERSYICLVDYRGFDGALYRDVAMSKVEPNGALYVSARGTCYACGFSLEAFAKDAERVNLEWIIPT